MYNYFNLIVSKFNEYLSKKYSLNGEHAKSLCLLDLNNKNSIQSLFNAGMHLSVSKFKNEKKLTEKEIKLVAYSLARTHSFEDSISLLDKKYVQKIDILFSLLNPTFKVPWKRCLEAEYFLAFYEEKQKKLERLSNEIIEENGNPAFSMWNGFFNKDTSEKYLSNITEQSIYVGDKRNFNSLIFNDNLHIEKEEKVSIILTAYNAENTIQYSISSILNQNYKNIELIVIDDCSTDSTYLTSLLSIDNDPRVKLIKNESNLGPFESKNKAINLIESNYILFHDADDIALPNKIETMMKYMKNNISIVESKWIKLNHYGVPMINFGLPFIRSNIGGFLVKKELFSKIGYFDNLKKEADNEFIERTKTLLNINSVKKIDNVLSFGLFNPKGLTTGNITGYSTKQGSLERIQIIENFRKKHIQLLKNNSF